MEINQTIQRLKEGNKRFVEDKLDGKLQGSIRREELSSGQSPYAIILSCADSRVVPELIFDTGLGELFVVRVAGNIANSSSIASIEYAVANCGSQLIVVLSHQNCGAVAAAIKGGDNGANLNHLLGHIEPALKEASEDASPNEIAQLNAKLTALELVNQSQIIKAAKESGSIQIIPAYYHLQTGAVEFLTSL